MALESAPRKSGSRYEELNPQKVEILILKKQSIMIYQERKQKLQKDLDWIIKMKLGAEENHTYWIEREVQIIKELKELQINELKKND